MIKILKQKQNHEVISHLKEMLSQAESGEIQALVGVAFFSENRTASFWCQADKAGVMPMLGEMRALEFEFIKRYVETE